MDEWMNNRKRQGTVVTVQCHCSLVTLVACSYNDDLFLQPLPQFRPKLDVSELALWILVNLLIFNRLKTRVHKN